MMRRVPRAKEIWHVTIVRKMGKEDRQMHHYPNVPLLLCISRQTCWPSAVTTKAEGVFMTLFWAFAAIFAGRRSSVGKKIVNVVVIGMLQRLA
jgi:hypothetical protein